MRRVLLIAGALIGLVNAARADDAFCFSQLSLFLQYVSPKTSQAVGTAVVTYKLGERPCYFFYGQTASGSGERPDANTVFELASVTKVFTTAILAIHQEHGFDPTGPVKPHLPPGYVLQPEEEGVTFQQLATFTGGFSWDDPPDFTNNTNFSQSDFVDDVNSLDPTDPKGPGPIQGEPHLPTFNFYSNGSTGFLGQILMHMDSRNGPHYPFDAAGFSNWISDNLTGPLKMPHTAVHPGGKWATGYKKNGKPADPFLWEPWGAAGALRSNTADMLTFLQANICAHRLFDPACIGFSEEILLALGVAHRPNDYTPPGTLPDPTIYIGGCGSLAEQAWAWRYLAPPVPNLDNVTPIISKDGGHPGFSTWIGFDPVKGYGLVILLNSGGINLISAGQAMIQHTQ